jgi:putative oxidoreductase
MMTKLCTLYFKTTHLLEKFCMPLLVLGMRIWMARIFWYSGLTKISSWQGTVFLFKNEYKVPVIPPEIAAYMATTFE